MKKFKPVLLACLALVAISAKGQKTTFCDTSETAPKPVRGTWVNLVWQDERNDYMNPPGSDYTDPALWRLKMKELHEFGIRYVVIMAVANEGLSYYPSDFMPPAYPAERESPVEAIMNAADELGMDVFMSCGWAQSQLDNLRDPAVRATQLRIMEETARKFSAHASFYGWYLPVEDSFDPVLGKEAVEAVNSLAAEARRLTPGKQVMISPYGLTNAAFDDPLFAERIHALTVDIIAYQDEVGCVREPQPMRRMKEHFRKLREIHDRCGIRFWANVESFTWDRGTNNWYSSLIPAAFGRYLSQIVGVSAAGAEEVLSFSIYGIYDKPSSPMPLGQPVLSARAWSDYCDWRAGRGRWGLLEATFRGTVSHKAVNNGGKMTDGVFGAEDTDDGAWEVFEDGKMETVIDMGARVKVKSLAARFLNYRPGSVSIPSAVRFSVSNDGKNFAEAGTAAIGNTPNDLHDCWIDIALADGLDTRARYIKVTAEVPAGKRIMCDEILINPKL